MPARILVVDDELPLERLIKQQFRQNIRSKEYEFIFANNGPEALEKLRSERPIDLVLTDINMPGMDGLTLIDKLKEIDRNIQAVVVSAYGDMENIRTAMNRGAFDFVTKPIDFQDLEITIKKTLEYVQEFRANLDKLNQTQAKLIQTEKMASIGQVVAGVAHEINNPTGCIVGNVKHAKEYIQDLINHLQLYQQQFPSPGAGIEEHAEEIDLEYLMEDLPKTLSSMKGATDRICQISNSLRIFSRSDLSSKVPANIHECLDSTLLILKYRLKGKQSRPPIQVVKEYGDLPPVECYPGQLNQVFMNILANAIEALEDLTVNSQQSTPSILIRSEVLEDNAEVVIHIKDNGPGMSAEVQERAFEPLFTTKPVGKGTGLGLFISRQIVEEKHGGRLTCISQPGEGAEFAIALPIQQ